MSAASLALVAAFSEFPPALLATAPKQHNRLARYPSSLMEKTAVTSICWIPCGKCRSTPIADEADDDEMREAHAEAMVAGAASSEAPSALGASTAGLEEFNLDKYDDDVDNDGGMQFFSVLNADAELAREKDPHLQGDADSDSDSEGFYEIKPDDKVFVAVSCEEESCMLEVYVFDEEEASTYVHHDLMLSAYPLCVEWISSAASESEGSFAAVASIDHSIQIWDLDRLDPLEPVLNLGSSGKAKGKTKKKRRGGSGGGAKAHDGPVLCLNGSTFNRSVLASGSADETVKVWDVSENSCVHTYKHHADKVQCVRWHPTEQAVLLSAAFDRRLALLDVRTPGQSMTVGLPAEAEAALWSRHNRFECLASVDNGGVSCFDVRKVMQKVPQDQQVLWTVQAHDVACTSLTDAPAPHLLVTCALDGEAKVWKCSGATPAMVFRKNLQAGPLFTCQSYAEAPALVCFGGKCPVTWDLSSEQLLLDAFNLDASKSV